MEKINKKITNCKKCPRLVHFREKIALEKRKQYQDLVYTAYFATNQLKNKQVSPRTS